MFRHFRTFLGMYQEDPADHARTRYSRRVARALPTTLDFLPGAAGYPSARGRDNTIILKDELALRGCHAKKFTLEEGRWHLPRLRA